MRKRCRYRPMIACRRSLSSGGNARGRKSLSLRRSCSPRGLEKKAGHEPEEVSVRVLGLFDTYDVQPGLPDNPFVGIAIVAAPEHRVMPSSWARPPIQHLSKSISLPLAVIVAKSKPLGRSQSPLSIEAGRAVRPEGRELDTREEGCHGIEGASRQPQRCHVGPNERCLGYIPTRPLDLAVGRCRHL